MATASVASDKPTLNWMSPNLPESYKLFEQKCNIYFDIKNTPVEKQVSYILFFTGDEGLRRYNSWGLSEEDKKKPAIVWEKFNQSIVKPSENYRVARLFLRNFHQQENENIDDFVARCKLQAYKCDFKDNHELEDRVIEQIIDGTRHTEVRKELLAKPNTLTLEQALEEGRKHEASMMHLKQLESIQETTNVCYVKTRNKSKCWNCGGDHPRGADRCPAKDTTCYTCGKQGHWGKVCLSRGNQRQPAHRNTTKQYQGKQNRESPWQARTNKTHSHINAIQQEDEDENIQDRGYEHITFAELCANSLNTTGRDVFALLDIDTNKRCKAKLKVKVDTGAQGNTLPLRLFKEMFPEKVQRDGYPNPRDVESKCTILTVYGGGRIKHYGTFDMQCRFKNSPWKNTAFYIVDVEGPAILGLPDCVAFQMVTVNCSIDAGTPVNNIKELAARYPKQFDRIGDFKGSYKIVLDSNAQPKVHAPRKTPIQLKDEIETELKTMQDKGIIRSISEPTEWVNSLAYSRKSNGQLRICLDPKDLNNSIRRGHHHTPTLEEITHKLSGATVFSKMDAKHGYWSVTLHEESQLLTTFHSPLGRMCFVRMPFGLKMSQDVYQHRMDMILEKCPGTIGISDDVIVYGKDETEHDKNLHNLMAVASEEGLTFNSEKCSIKSPSIVFFGMVFDKDGIKPDPGKVEDIHSIPSPNNKQQLQEFLGIATYMGPFIPNLSHHTAPLREILKKDAEFEWSANQQSAFNKIKELICQETTLSYFNPEKETVVQVDACTYGLGAALLQDGKPIAFASKSLTETESRYANIERELLAVVFGAQRFHTYIYGKHFTVESDHKPLEMISLKNLTAAPPRLLTMLLKLQGYDMTIKYRPGREMILADSLSRAPNKRNASTINLDTKIALVQFSNEKISTLQHATKEDGILSQLFDIIVTGWPEKQRDLPRDLRPYWSYRDELSVENGIILKGDRIVIPESMQPDILKQIHAGHQGITKCQSRAKSSVYWQGISDDLERTVKGCSVCQEYSRSLPAQPLLQHEIPTRPWQVLGSDIFQFEGREYLIVADYYSKFPFIRRLPIHATSAAVIGLMREIFAEHGIPEKIISDNGPQYSAGSFKTFTGKYEIVHVTSSPHYPRSNGFIERTIQTVKQALRKAKVDNMDPEMALLCIRTTPIDSKLPSPAEILYGRKIQGNLPVKICNTHPHRDEIHQRLKERQDAQKEYHDKHTRDLPPLYKEQPVVIQDQTSGLWTPAKVVEECPQPRSYIVQTPDGRSLRRNRRHVQAAVTTPSDANTTPHSITPNTPSLDPHDPTPSVMKDTGGCNSDGSYTTSSGRLVRKPARYSDEV